MVFWFEWRDAVGTCGIDRPVEESGFDSDVSVVLLKARFGGVKSAMLREASCERVKRSSVNIQTR